MIHALWLLLIVPASVFIGFMICAILTVGKEADRREGARDG